MFDLTKVSELAAKLAAHIDSPTTVLAISLLAYVIVLVVWHRKDGPMDFRKALLDPPAEGAASLSRLGQLTALVVSTQLLVYFAVKGTLAEWMFALYMVTWAGTYIAAKHAPKPDNKPPEQK